MKNCVRESLQTRVRGQKKSQNVVQKVMIVYVFSVLPYIRN